MQSRTVESEKLEKKEVLLRRSFVQLKTRTGFKELEEKKISQRENSEDKTRCLSSQCEDKFGEIQRMKPMNETLDRETNYASEPV